MNGVKLSKDQWEYLMEEGDTNKDGKISKDEFVKMMMKKDISANFAKNLHAVDMSSKNIMMSSKGSGISIRKSSSNIDLSNKNMKSQDSSRNALINGLINEEKSPPKAAGPTQRNQGQSQEKKKKKRRESQNNKKTVLKKGKK